MISVSLYNGHNSCICIMKNGKIILNWELERFTRIKHDYGFNQSFYDKSLELCNIEHSDVDMFITNRTNHMLRSKWPNKEKYIWPLSRKIPFTGKQKTHKFVIDGKKYFAINHHLAHASSAYYTSPYTASVIITWDGGGDMENYSSSFGDRNKIHDLKGKYIKWPYELISYWNGLCINNYRIPRLHIWDPGSACGKIMALASYGKPDVLLKKMIHESMRYRYEDCYDGNFPHFNNGEILSDTTSQRSQDVAASLQSLTEDIMQENITEVWHQYKSMNLPDSKLNNLCVAGGLFLNCVANSRIKTPFRRMHVPPFPNDCGLAAGMSLYYWHHVLDNPKSNEHFTPYLGPKYENYQVEHALKNSSLRWKKYSIEDIVDYLCERNILVMCRGRSESGPRALGHRSIICIPDGQNTRDFLNFQVKKREWYRPYAPIILDKYADDVLEESGMISPYMSKSAIIKEKWRDKLVAVTHVDNSTRPQIIEKNHEPFIYSLIEKIYEKTGIPVLLNTSFNMQESIVETPENAIVTFQKFKDIKKMILHDYIVSKD